ncbi:MULTISPECIES: hypothetical protein [Burkholderia]|jgi:hypothetical protein|uniref:Uncharacterized protein n=2 Tax=Burkholderia contaminans TaxID=488447 RepID=A0A1E3FKL7_9BURK|nr:MULTISPECIES: hypothetical protein [Burkholderia]UTP21742.1 hypothetical protein NMB33_15210 [Burkholderia sp. FXe9]KKL41198.1 hypothetical protein WR31_16475 [Burkholderia contaminans LMG 23361]MBA9834935.1 hypothetical protein [Burkholderia contaminans]MBA9842797.1 hypothetical protein [Burkholderia contaminans]MBA9867562.1 hypothetical protein [Burkholderia contaminans]
MLDMPHFTQYVDDTQSVDPLGTAAVIEALYRSIYPGINNAVEFVRVYSAICWMVRQIDLAAAKAHEPDIAALSKAGIEKIQLLLTWYNKMQEVPGLAGADRRYPEDNRRETLSFKNMPGNMAARRLEVDPDFVVGEGAHFLTAPQYRPSLVNGMRFLAESSALPGTYRLTTAGEALADGYEAAIADHPRRDWLADVNKVTVRRDDVLAMGEMLDLREPSPEEMQAFVAQYYPDDAEVAIGPRWTNRWSGLTLALRALEAEQPHAKDQGTRGVAVSSIRYTMARGYSLAGERLDLRDIEEVQGWWANLQLRQYQRLALDTLFRNVSSWIHDATVDEGPREIQDCADGIGAALERALPEEHRQSVSSLVTQLEQLKGAYGSFYEASPFVASLRLEEMLGQLQHVCNFAQRSEEELLALRNSYIALVYCAVEARNLLSNLYVQQQFETDRLSLTTLRDLLERYENSRPAEFIAHVVQFYVVLLHFSVVQERTYDGRNRFLFMQGDNGLERVASRGGIGGVGLMADRLFHALLLLAQCGLVKRYDDGTFALTAAGRRRLAAS